MQVIFLNGASSSGKSTIARVLQGQLEDNFLYFSIDHVIDMMPTRTCRLDSIGEADGFSWRKISLRGGHTGMRIVSGPFGAKMESLFRRLILTIVQNGQRLIVDTVAEGAEEITNWKRLLQDYPCCFVGVLCSLDVLEHREKTRGDRMPGSAAEQSFRVHHEVDYDLIVESDKNTPEVCAGMIIEHIRNRQRR